MTIKDLKQSIITNVFVLVAQFITVIYLIILYFIQLIFSKKKKHPDIIRGKIIPNTFKPIADHNTAINKSLFKRFGKQIVKTNNRKQTRGRLYVRQVCFCKKDKAFHSIVHYQ